VAHASSFLFTTGSSVDLRVRAYQHSPAASPRHACCCSCVGNVRRQYTEKIHCDPESLEILITKQQHGKGLVQSRQTSRPSTTIRLRSINYPYYQENISHLNAWGIDSAE
jgi:hypothetical protein